MAKEFNSAEYMTLEEFDRRVYSFIDEQAELLVREVLSSIERQKQQVESYNKRLVIR
jgi:hypothetical protein